MDEGDDSSLWLTITFSSPLMVFIAFYTDIQQAVEVISYLLMMKKKTPFWWVPRWYSGRRTRPPTQKLITVGSVFWGRKRMSDLMLLLDRDVNITMKQSHSLLNTAPYCSIKSKYTVSKYVLKQILQFKKKKKIYIQKSVQSNQIRFSQKNKLESWLIYFFAFKLLVLSLREHILYFWIF